MVVCFTCNHCPVAVAYEDRFVEFVKDYKGKKVAFVAINVNNLPADKLPKMKERAKEKKFNFDYLYDPTQKIARDFGATCTPHLFVLCKKRKIAYMGAFDDQNHPDKVAKQHVREAVDALLAGKTPEVTETRQRGCGIKYEDKGKDKGK
jgi:thiol-disulfide isomerase/thioredoxin